MWFSTLPVGNHRHRITKAGTRPWTILKCSESLEEGVKSAKAQNEHMFSGLPLGRRELADLARWRPTTVPSASTSDWRG